MAKLPPMKPMGKGKPAATTAATSKKKATPATEKATAPKKTHARTTKPSEADHIERGKRLAVSYLAQRDGMELDMATLIVESMTPDEVNDLVSESATAVLEKGTEPKLEPAAEEEPVAVDFLTVPALAEYEFDKFTFFELVTIAIEYAKTKNEAEKQYKAAKKQVMAAMQAAGTPLVDCFGVGLAVYKGGTSTLSEEKLLEAGVDADMIAKGWKKTTYDDVRITTPKEA